MTLAQAIDHFLENFKSYDKDFKTKWKSYISKWKKQNKKVSLAKMRVILKAAGYKGEIKEAWFKPENNL